MLCRAIEHEAHFCLCQSSVHCLPIESILLAESVQNRGCIKFDETWNSYYWCNSHLVWTVYSSNSAGNLSKFNPSFVRLMHFHVPIQVVSRLFPFKRGLCHAYWAPNFWALYNIADKVGTIASNKSLNFSSNTGGLVQEFEHQYLPVIRPHTTFIITILAMIPCVLKIAFGTYHKYET